MATVPGQAQSHSSETADLAPYPRPVVRWYAVIVLLIMYMLSFTDRQILALMIVPLQKDLGLTDVQLSLLQGMAFALLYATAGLFVGWAIDRFSRRILIMVSVMFWSLSCAVCGLANGFWSLFAGRVGVGIGEATLIPGAYSMLSDLFPKGQLSLAIGVFTMGANLGIAVSFTLGGLIVGLLAGAESVAVPIVGSLRTWQLTFIAVGLPGLVLALLMLTLPEPIRRGRQAMSEAFLPPLLKLFGQRPKLFTCHFIGFSLNIVIGYVVLVWSPALLARKFGWEPAAIGPWLGLFVGGGGMLGPIVSGAVADALYRRGMIDVHFRLQMVYSGLTVLIAALALTTASPWIFLSAVGAIYFISAATVPHAGVSLQLVTPNELRGRITAVYGMISTLMGLGLGPLVVALITEHVLHDRAAVGLSMAIVISGAAALHVLFMALGVKTYRKAVIEMTQGAPEPA